MEPLIELNKIALERAEPCVLSLELLGFAPQLLHPLLVLDLPVLVFFPQLRILHLKLVYSFLVLDPSPLEPELPSLVVNTGPPVEGRQPAPEPWQLALSFRSAALVVSSTSAKRCSPKPTVSPASREASGPNRAPLAMAALMPSWLQEPKTAS